MAAPSPDLREYDVTAGSTHTPGRVLCSVRNHHIIVDGPVQNGFPGEEITPAELFLAGVASCGVELVQMLAQKGAIPLESISVASRGTLDRSRPARMDYTVFNRVHLQMRFKGVTEEQANQLADGFMHR